MTLTVRVRQRRHCRMGQLCGCPFSVRKVPGRSSARLIADQRPEEEMVPEPNKDLVRRRFEEIWNRQDLAVADDLMAEDYRSMPWRPSGRPNRGG
jgi:hypothetical protein